MINVSNEFIEEIPNPGKMKKAYIYYDNKEVRPEIMDISFETALFKSTTRQIELEIKNNENIIDKEFKTHYGLLINGDFEYIDYGTFKVTECEEVIKENKIKATAYDNMVKFMIKYNFENLNLPLPCTILQLVQAMCKHVSVGLYSTNFFNSDLVIEEDLFTPLNCTYRDVIDYICQATLTTAIIKDDKLYFKSIEDTGIVVGPEILKTLNLKSKFGPCNSLVLGRGDLNDNIYSKDNASIQIHGLQEIKFNNNEILDKRREQVIDKMFNHIKGLKYNSFEATDLGVGFFEAADMIKVQDKKQNEYSVLILSASIRITSGTVGTMSSEEPATSTTKYQYATDSEKRQSRTEIIVDKQEKKITQIIEEQTEHEGRITVVEQDVEGIKQKVESTAEYKRNAEGITQIHITEAGQANVLKFVVKGSKTYENHLFPRTNLYPRSNLHPNRKGG